MDDGVSEKVDNHVEIFRAMESARDPVLTAHEIAYEAGIETAEAERRLWEMKGEGKVKEKSGVWWAVPAPYLEMKTIVTIQPTDVDEPLSISDIQEIICDT